MKVFGKYEALEELDTGAFVSMLRGRDRMFQRDALIKVFYVEAMTSAARQRFLREVQATVKLAHPNIVSIYDAGEQDEYAYIAMEQLEGEDLRHFADRQGKLSLAAKVQFMIEVCEGLAYAHDNGVIHRDIKPGNIFILKSGRPRIVDFAIARAFTSKTLPAGSAIATPEYMAPEQFRNQRGDARSDIFSVSLVFFELLTNRHPFPGKDIAHEIQSEAAPPITDLDPMLPSRLATLIARGLSKDPASRIQTAAEYAFELRKVAGDAEGAEVSTKTSEKSLPTVPTVEDKLSELDFATKIGDVRDILAITDEIRRCGKEWFGEDPKNDPVLERVAAACRGAFDAIVEISQSRIYSAITRGDVAAAQLDFHIVEQVCSRDSHYSELAGQIYQQIQNLVSHQERGETNRKMATGDSYLDQGRVCPVCGQSNPMDAVLCESCGSRVPGSRRLAPAAERATPGRARVVVRPKADVAQRSYKTLIVAAGVVVLVLAIVALVFKPTLPEGPGDLPVIGTALVAKDALLRTAPDAADKARSLAKGESVELVGKLPDLKPEAWMEVRLKADATKGFLRNSDLESVNTDTCSFDLWHVGLLLPGIYALKAADKTEGINRIEAVMSRCPAAVTDELRMTMAETHAREASALPWKLAQTDISAAKGHLKGIKNQVEYSGRIEGVDVTLNGLMPESVAASPVPSPVIVENTDAAEKLLSQGKIDLEIAETRSQLNDVIGNMNRILKMKFTQPRGLELQTEARRVRDKAANSLVLAK